MERKMKIHDLNDSKLEGAPRPDTEHATSVTAIVKTKVANYVPAGFQVRGRIDEYMFTAECSEEALTAAQSDPNVESLSPTRKLRSIQ